MKQEEFIEIIKENQKLIYKVCHIYCSNHQKRKDLEQDILLQLWLSMDRYDGRVKLSTWIYRVALNTSITFYRLENKLSRQRVKIDSTIISMTTNSENQDDRIALLNELIQELNAHEKALILLYLEKVMQKDIAEILGISASNVSTKIARIKEALKQKMNLKYKCK